MTIISPLKRVRGLAGVRAVQHLPVLLLLLPPLLLIVVAGGRIRRVEAAIALPSETLVPEREVVPIRPHAVADPGRGGWLLRAVRRQLPVVAADHARHVTGCAVRNPHRLSVQNTAECTILKNTDLKELVADIGIYRKFKRFSFMYDV